MVARLFEFGPVAFFYLLALAAQVSGYTSPTAATILTVLGTVWLIGSLVYLGVRRFARSSKMVAVWRRRLTVLLSMLPIIGIVVGGMIFVGSVAWMLADNRRGNEEILEMLSRYMLPRHLSDEQIAIIGDHLKKYGPLRVKMLVLKNNEEASSYRSDMQRALTLGGWRVPTIDYSFDVQEGVRISFNDLRENAGKESDPEHPTPGDVLREALRLAGVQLESYTQGANATTTDLSLTISIGSRRMDDGDLVSRKQMKEYARRILKEH